MRKSDLTECGAISLGLGCVPVYFVEDEGAFVFKSDVDGEWMYIGEVAAKGVLEAPSAEIIEKQINEGVYGENTIGAIFTDQCLIVIEDENTADNRLYYEKDKSTGKEYKIDLESTFDGIDEDEDDDGTEIANL